MLKPVTLFSAAALLFAAAVVPATADTPMESSHMHSTMMESHGKGHGGHHGKMMMDSSSGNLSKEKGSFSWGAHNAMMVHGKGHGKGHGKMEHSMMGGKGHDHGHGMGMMGHPKPTM